MELGSTCECLEQQTPVMGVDASFQKEQGELDTAQQLPVLGEEDQSITES